MSIKKLFDKSRQGSRNYSDYSTDKETFDEVESSRNAAAIQEEKRTYVPQIDYSDPKNFVKFGSAELYYSGALNRIADYYPYDGSDAEKNEFYNNLFDGEKYIFDNLYPRYNGFAILGADGITYTSMTSDGYGRPAAASTEHISFKGGPGSGSGGTLSNLGPNPYNNKKQVSNIYDKTIYETAGLPSDFGTGTRESNLKSNFDTGVTVEFWLKKESFDTTSTEKEVIFDMWNNELSSSDSYGRLTIELTGAASGSPFVITAQSGTISASIFVDSIGSGPTTGSLTDWHHYAFRFYNSGSDLVSKFYVDGRFDDATTYVNNKLGEITTSAMLGRIGALMTSPSGSSAIAGDGTLSASVDDFRFWKTDRNSRQIGTQYFVNVGGGANTDISNADLGVYYKFNEGITDTSSVDSIVLDYAGRVTNAIWTGYDTNSRNTGSAIVLAGAATREYKEPVVRRNHPSFINLQESLQATGSAYDGINNASFMNYAPSWVLSAHDETENKNLKNLSHIAGTYFDKLYLLGQELPKIRHLNYTTASNSPVPFASHLPTSMGMYVPDLFVDADILERLSDRTDTELFENKLNEVKNLIYLNLYNNITNIYKSKGTEKAIRNVFRCFNIDDSLIKMNVYNKSATYEVKTNLKQSVIEKSTINFNTQDNISAVVYQAEDSSNPESRGYISGSAGTGPQGPEKFNGATIEADFMFPRFFRSKDKFDRIFTEVSLFGLHTVDTGSADSLSGVDTTLLAGGVDYANFQVFAVRDEPYSDNVYFKLTSSNSPYPLPELTSSMYLDVYDESRWNISVRIKPKDYPNAGMVSGSLAGKYDVIFRGVNADLGVVKNSFELTSELTNEVASFFLRSPKRMYVGARRENLTGSTVLQKSDVQALSCKYWAKFIDNTSLDMHAHGEENVGVTDAYRNIRPIDSLLTTPADLTNKNTLALSWNFDNVTASDSGGSFTVDDYSSGSYSLRQNYGWLGKISGYQHSGKGYGFANSSTTVANKERLNSFSFVDPEQAVASNMINILTDDDEVLEFYETLPNYVFTVEKSMYAAISEEMVNFFAGAVDFNNVIGEPVNRYRSRYKGLEKLRQAFFERVSTTSEVEKFVEYYKWFDDAISTIISQLVPASADFVDDVLNVVESHALERNKYETKFPTLESRQPTIESAFHGYTEKSYLYRLGSSTVPRSPRDTTTHKLYWKARAERTADEITSGDATVDEQREIYRKIINSNPHLSRSASTLFDAVSSTSYLEPSYARRNFIKNFSENVSVTRSIKGGVNFEDNKNIHFVHSSVRPAGPVNTSGSLYVPLNVLLSFMEDLVKVEVDNDPKLVTEKIKRYTKVLSGRDFEEGVGYKNMKSSIAFPFNIISGSVSTGYQKQVSQRLSASIMLTNLHNDVYGPDMEVPMQGPFTNYAVGGHQSRHIRLNDGTDSSTTRPEAWRILLGTCPGIPSGAIGLVGADYPDPNTSLSASAAYPYRPHQKAVYYRDMVAKRPVNIRNIRMTTGSTILGNYTDTYQYVQTVGAYNNPRHFVDQQPDLPDRVFVGNATSSMVARTFLDMHRTSDNHTQNVAEYDTGYLDGAINKSVIINRFSAPGGIETLTRGYQDFRSSEFSVYNGLNNRNLSVIKPWQGPSGTISTPAVNGDTTDIQVFDIHGKDYGLYSHLARHTARFGRDSLFESNPGASYEELPGFHKVHRNNLTRKELCNYYITPPAGAGITNNQAFSYDPLANTGATIWSSNSSNSNALVESIRSNSSDGFSWSGWIKFGKQDTGIEENIVNIGSFGGTKGGFQSGSLFRIFKIYSGTTYRLKAELTTQETGNFTSSGSSMVWEFEEPTIDFTSDYNHYAVTWDRSTAIEEQLDTSAARNSLTIYFNGVSQSVSLDFNDNYRFYNTDATTVYNFKGHGAIDVPGDEFVVFGGNHTYASEVLSASIDEYSIWTRPLSADDVTEIYNSGIPCDITASNAYTTNTTKLWDWVRFEPSGGASAAIIDSANPGTYNATNKITGFNDYLQGVPLAGFGVNNNSSLTTDVLVGCASTPAGNPVLVEQGVCDKGTFDNFNIQHQIPRSSKQYAWLTASLESDNGWVGFTPKDFLVKQSKIGIDGDKYVEVYNFASASDFGSYLASARRFGLTNAEVSNHPSFNQFLPTVPTLHTNIHEPLDGATNTIGYANNVPLIDSATSNPQYLNRNENFAKFITPTVAKASPPAFNALMWHRGNQYGFNSWNALRQANHPILRNERTTNTITVVGPQGNDDELVTYNLPPVSNRGKPNMVSFNIGSNSHTHTFKVTDENERIYYNSPIMDNRFAPDFNSFVTPGEQLIAIAKSGQNKINWVVYSQQLFPSIRNEFVNSSTDKVAYDNLYWRDSRNARNTVNTVYERPVTPTGSYTAENAFGIYVSQSSWPLDAPVDFETRATCFQLDSSGSASEFGTPEVSARFATASAGQLQNVYMGLMTGAYAVEVMDDDGRQDFGNTMTTYGFYALSPLYARKHVLQAAQSVKSPYGPGLPYTDLSGGLTRDIVSASFNTGSDSDNRWIDIGAGEALWEAPSQAGYYKKNNSGSLEFISAPSKPWFTDYETFRYDLKLKAQGFSVVPEFRISEHIDDLLLDDNSPNRYAGLNLEIPHVSGANSEEDPAFFTTYTNSEFLKDFLRIKNTSLLNAKEIRISCTGAIRFNPYKGFYPVQRTVQMVEEFKDSYVNNLIASQVSTGGPITNKPGTGSAQVLDPTSAPISAFGATFFNHNSRKLKPLTDTIFSPGILYNTIKSGIAVDYPIVLDPKKLRYQDYAYGSGSGGAENDLSSGSWAIEMAAKYQNNALLTSKFRPGYRFFDERLPFETMLEPEKYLAGKSFYDMEANPFIQTNAATASFIKNDSKNDYKKMASNFFGSVPSFFLENEEFTSIKSALNTETFKFKGTETYMMRVVLERSTAGPRTYENEFDGHNRAFESGSKAANGFSLYGGRPILEPYAGSEAAAPSRTAGYPLLKTGSYIYAGGVITGSDFPDDYFEIPQDPLYNLDFKETFTMYSRPSAFGPDLTGRTSATREGARQASGAVDSFVGVNPAYTPPYTNGEAWADLIFRPNSGSTYTLKDIMAETQLVCWRFDAGPLSVVTPLGGLTAFTNTMIYDVSNFDADDSILPLSYFPYGGGMINHSAMQLTSSFNLFGIEREDFVETDKFGNVSTTRPGTTVGERWVIRSKFETPMLNFSGSDVTYPTNYGGESTPRGMWHQFGKIPQQKEGVFISVQDVPTNWLKNHYLVKDYESIYNDYADDGVENYEKQVQSLADLVGFNTSTKKKVGKLKEKTILREAIVAIPYIVEKSKKDDSQRSGNQYRKSFIEIPKQRFEAAKSEAFGSAVGDTFETAGASISKQLQKMERYIFPPQLDFLSNPEGAVDPFVMYIFEFEYKLDKDDLSYIWQNLAPRDYQRIEFQHESVAHELIDAELLNEQTLEENQALRWMVFKVKQKSQDSYWDKTDTQIAKRRDDTSTGKITQLNLSQKAVSSTLKSLNTYKYTHNWPYDYVSFVEMIKVNSEILFSERPQITQLRADIQLNDLTKSMPGTLKLQKMTNPVIAPFSSTMLKYDPIGSLKGPKLQQAKKEFASKKARKAASSGKKVSTTMMSPVSKSGTKTSGNKTNIKTSMTTTRGGGNNTGGGGNSGGGSSY